ncbi:DUF2259 domain-containing protein [bacterium]|nr:DUF2259 domain-containing protein [bacterium]
MSKILFFILPILVWAGDSSKFNIIGFSKDGSNIAFQRYGTQDGSGFPYSEIFIVKSEKNDYFVQPIKTVLEDENSNEESAKTKNLTVATSSIKKAKIVLNNIGTKVAMDSLKKDDSSEEESDNRLSKVNIKKKAENKNEKERFQIIINGKIYDLVLEESAFGEKHPDFEIQPVIFTLYLESNGKKITLQKDTSLPKSRGLALSYTVNSVYTHNNYIAVFVNIESQGFEGPDTRQIIITGKLPK